MKQLYLKVADFVGKYLESSALVLLFFCFGLLSIVGSISVRQLSSHGSSTIAIRLALFLGLILLAASWTLFVGALKKRLGEGSTKEEPSTMDSLTIRSILDSIPDDIFFKDTDGQFRAVSASLAERLGLKDPSLAVGKTDFDFWPEEQAKQTKETEEAVLESGLPLILKEERKTWPDGKETWMSTVKIPIKKESGKVIGLAAISRDITDRRRALEALKESEQNYRLMFDNSPLGIVRINTGGVVAACNNNFREMFAPQSTLGEDFNILSAVNEDMRKAIETCMLGQSGHFEGECFPAATGRSAFVQADFTPSLSENGSISGCHGVIEDITQRKELEEQLRVSQKVEAVGKLAGGIAHEFNNLVMVITGFSELVLSGLEEDSPQREDVQQIKEAGIRAAKLTKQLLAFGRRQPLESKVTTLNGLVADMDKMVKHLIGEDIQLSLILSPEPDSVKVDPAQMKQVIMDLVVNAREAMPEGGRLTMKTENIQLDTGASRHIPESEPGHFVRLTVEDTGIGMNKSTLDQIFEPFFSTKSKRQGTGLGLSTVHGIVKQHGGWINVYSEPSHGSTFRVYLPACTEKATAVEKEPLEGGETYAPGSQRILIVEDEPGVRRFAVNVLRRNGYIVQEAGTAGVARRIFRERKGQFDLVFSDVVLPDDSGVDLVDELLRSNPDLKVLISSGYTEEKARWSVIQDRGFPFLQKPYPVANLLRTIRNIFEKPE